MTTGRPAVQPFGDAALLLSFEERIDPATNALVLELAGALQADRAAGAPWSAPVPAYASLLLPYDPLAIGWHEAEGRLRLLVERVLAGELAGKPEPPRPDAKLIEIPVRYGGADGPDLANVAGRCGLSESAVIELHSSTTYRSYFLGFAPGFAYLGTLPEQLQLARRDTPRPRVRAGSVAIAGQQTAVYPLSTPGGWHLIGRTEVRVWDPDREPPALIGAGASVRFVPVQG
jgi:inhibitor of KinA